GITSSEQSVSFYLHPLYGDEATEEKGERARMASFVGAMAIADLVKTTLGPKGMVEEDSVIVTKVQDDEVGDGTMIDQNILLTLAHATTWDISLSRKVNVFMWRLSLDRLPHRLNLSSRGMDIPAISCPSCNANVESANHVFFECDIATDMWKLVFRWCDIPLFQASSWDSFNDWIISWHASKEKKHRFYVITTSVIWWLWRYQNSVTFNSQPLRKSNLFDNVRFSSFLWLHNRDHMKLSWNDWLMYPLSITRNGNG
ncbi:RNA-directed DNA polymerase, eukaryota, partial [Tanacetum coccineum]